MQSLHSVAKTKAAFFAPFILICLILSIPLAVTAQDTIDREIVVRFKPDVIRMPVGQIRAPITAVNMSTRIRNLMLNFDAVEIALGMPSFQRSDTLRVLPDGRVFRLPDYTNLFVVLLGQADRRSALIDSLMTLPFVVSAEKNQKAILRELVPNDTYFTSRQWNMRNTGQSGGTSGADIKATLAWDFSTGSSSVILGIVDTGIKADHEDLAGRVSGDTGFGDFHGTHVAGIAGANGNNGRGVAGVDWHAQLVSQRIDLGGIPEMAQAVNAAVAAGARVLNNSWGVSEYSSVLYNAFLAAQQAGVLSVVANPESGAESEYPNSFAPWIFNVAATTDQDIKATYSFDRNYTDVAAPGGNAGSDTTRNVFSTVTYNTALGPYDDAAGTSMAAPHATGIAGLLLSFNPSLHNYDLEWIIKRSADDKGTTGRDPSYGYGRVNAYQAVRHIASPYQITHGSATLSQINSNIQVTFNEKPLPELAAGVYWCDRYKLEKTMSFSPPYGEVPWAWLSQTGYSAANPNDAKEYLYESSTITSSTVRTFFYYIRTNSLGQTINKWAPVNPNLFSCEYAVLGMVSPPPLSVYISGPDILNTGEQGTWTTHPTGGTGPYGYEWYYRWHGTGSWIGPVGTGQYYSRTMWEDDFELQVKVTSGNENAYDTYYVIHSDMGKRVGSGSDMQTAFIPERLILQQNFPNPFNPETEIRFGVPENLHVQLVVVDLLGHEIRKLIDSNVEAGYHSVIWNGRDNLDNAVPSGIYIYKIVAGRWHDWKKLTLMR